MRIDDRIIRRLAYDGNYQRALQMLTDIIVSMDGLIKDQNKVIQLQESRIQRLEKANKLTQELVVAPLIADEQEGTSLNDVLKVSYEKNSSIDS